jgi:hypothetical protein
MYLYKGNSEGDSNKHTETQKRRWQGEDRSRLGHKSRNGGSHQKLKDIMNRFSITASEGTWWLISQF